MGCPELGKVSLAEIEDVRGRAGSPSIAISTATADKPISAYAEEARRLQRINA